MLFARIEFYMLSLVFLLYILYQESAWYVVFGFPLCVICHESAQNFVFDFLLCDFSQESAWCVVLGFLLYAFCEECDEYVVFGLLGVLSVVSLLVILSLSLVMTFGSPFGIMSDCHIMRQ